MLLCYEMQSFHVRGLCGILATAVDQGTLTLDEAVAFLRVHQPAVMQPVAPDVRPDAAHEYHVDKVAGLLVECFQVWANQAGGREKDWLVALDEQERIWAKERQEDAQKKVAQMIKKRVADQKSESQKMKRGK